MDEVHQRANDAYYDLVEGDATKEFLKAGRDFVDGVLHTVMRFSIST